MLTLFLKQLREEFPAQVQTGAGGDGVVLEVPPQGCVYVVPDTADIALLKRICQEKNTEDVLGHQGSSPGTLYPERSPKEKSSLGLPVDSPALQHENIHKTLMECHLLFPTRLHDFSWMFNSPPSRG